MFHVGITVFEPSHVEAVRDTFPEWMAFVFAFLSYFGSVWIVAPTVVCCYWLVDRHRFAPWVGIVMGGYAVMVGLKGFFSVARPGVGPAIAPESLPTVVALVYAPAVEVGTTSFPSGHAIAGTVLWTMLALETNYGTRRMRYGVAATMIALVGFSRVGAGLHYPFDVVIGTAIALGYLAVVLAIRAWLSGRGQETATQGVFATVATIALLALLVGGRPDAAALFGAAIAGLALWWYAPPPQAPWSLTVGAGARILTGLALLAAIAALLVVLEGYAAWFLVGLVGAAVVLALPHWEASTGAVS
ncbi:phosphatase PAP2 family protein [Halobacteria archaeon AArc-dxtr1]|nr:phosphatase PAP2 family protein [Halobacteria archaeon AArc-dxtr1]